MRCFQKEVLTMVPPASNFDFKEKAEVDKYYPQFYHKTDKVRVHASMLFCGEV